MIYRFVFLIIVLNLLYELVEVVFPAKKMKTSVKSYVLILVFYVICKYIESVI